MAQISKIVRRSIVQALQRDLADGTRQAAGPFGAVLLLGVAALLIGDTAAAGVASPGEVIMPEGVQSWAQTDWRGGPGQADWDAGDPTAYATAEGIDSRTAGEIGLGYTLPFSQTGDLNRDGYPDLVFANWLDQYDPPHHSVDSYVYWGGPGGFSDQRRLGLPTRGAVGVSVADLDEDGYLDLVFSNQRAGLYADPAYAIDSYIYWGGVDGYSPERCTGLPTLGAMSSAIADLNGDGYLDIVFANSTDGLTTKVDSYIYWGGPAGYSPAKRSGLPVQRAVGVSAVDLNQDGYLDLVFSNTTDGASSDVDSYIYWGSAAGYGPERRTGLPTVGCYDNAAGDLNRDGYLDLVFTNRYRSAYGVIYDFAVPSYIYWGSAGGYSATARRELPTIGAVGLSLADLDQDGYLDIIFSNGSDRESYIYWGDATASYGVDRRSTVRTAEGLANSVADLNADGHLDLVFSGDWNGLIYWGDGSRLFPSRRRSVVSTVTSLGNAVAGASLAMAGSSMGTVYTRPITNGVTVEESLVVPRIHAASGHLDSSQFDARGTAHWLRLAWQAEVPAGTGLALAVARRDEGGDWSAWQPAAEITAQSEGQVALSDVLAASRYVRYRAVLSSSADHRVTPRLLEITLDYELLPPTSTPTPTETASPTATATLPPTATSTATVTAAPTDTATPVASAEQYLPLIYQNE